MAEELTAYDAQDAGIAQPIIYPLGIDEGTGGIDPGEGISFTYGVAGVGFLSAASNDLPYQRGLANVLKDQVNNSEQPGDQSFTDWWYRSQTDWSKGAGTQFMEPVTDEKVQSSFASSFGVDVWEPGELKLLPSTKQEVSFAANGTTKHCETLITRQSAWPEWGRNRTYIATGEDVRFYVDDDYAESVVLDSADLAASEYITGMAYVAGFVFVSTDRSVWMLEANPFFGITVYPGPIGVGQPIKAFSLPSAHDSTRVFAAKDRLIITQRGYLWDEAPPGELPSTVTLATADALYNAGFATSWVAAADTPNSVLMASVSDTTSSIYSVGLDTSGALPVLDAPRVVAEFPSNESVTSLATYLGTYVLIGTDLGIRVGTIQANLITYGPLIGSPAPTGKFAVYDRFAFAPVADAGNGRSGCVRIDLSELDATGRAAWANDRMVPTGGLDVAAVAVALDGSVHLLGKELTKAGDTVALYSDAAEYEPLGFLQTGTIRYGTTEKKYYDQVNVQLSSDWGGNLTVSALDDDGNVSLVGSVSNLSGSDIDLSIDPVDPSSTLRLGFTLTPSDDGLASPVIRSWQLRALPSVTRQRLIRVQLLDFDFERDHRGVPFGYEGYAITRWKKLEEQSRNGWPFTFQDLYTNETFRVVLESVNFSQTAPPSYASGFGGIIDLTVRVI